MPHGFQVGGQPDGQRVAAALRAGDHHGNAPGGGEVGRLQRREDVPDAGRRGGTAVQFGFLDEAADPEHQPSGGETDPEQGAPGVFFRERRDEQRVEQRGGAPADRPAGLHQADGAAAVFVADHLAHQNGAGCPLAAEAEALERPEDEELVEVLGEAAEEGEDGVPKDGHLQDADAAIAVGQRAGEPAAEGGDQQGNGGEFPGLAGGDLPQRQQTGDDEAENLHVERIERPAAEAGTHGAALARCQVGEPGNHS